MSEIGDIAKRCYENLNSGCCLASIEHQAERDQEVIQAAIDEAMEELQEKLDQSEKHNRNLGAANISQQDWNWKLKAENERLKEMVNLSTEFVEWCELCKSFEETTIDSDHCQECLKSKCFCNWRCCESHAKKAQTGVEE